MELTEADEGLAGHSPNLKFNLNLKTTLLRLGFSSINGKIVKG